MCVWGHCPMGTHNCIQDPTFWLMILGFPDECGVNKSSSLFHLLCVKHQFYWQQSHLRVWYCHHHAWWSLSLFSPPNIFLIIVATKYVPSKGLFCVHYTTISASCVWDSERIISHQVVATTLHNIIKGHCKASSAVYKYLLLSWHCLLFHISYT